jgi:hypothetical protein
MTGRRCLLSPEVRAALIEAIAGGAFDWVAAEAAGIGRRTFYDWMRRGEAGEQPFAELLTAVRRARAEARVGAERTIRKRNPLAWLRLGPGRERADEPGWTSPNKPAAAGATESATEKLLREALEGVPDPEAPGG